MGASVASVGSEALLRVFGFWFLVKASKMPNLFGFVIL